MWTPPPALLLLVFATHMPVFAWRYLRTREIRHAATTLTFALLTLAYGLRVFAPGIALEEVQLFPVVRVLAWAAASVSIGLLIRHWAGKRGAKP